MVGAAITVERAITALAAATLWPPATSVAGSHSSRPKLTSPQESAASVRAAVTEKNPPVTGGTAAWLSGAGM